MSDLITFLTRRFNLLGRLTRRFKLPKGGDGPHWPVILRAACYGMLGIVAYLGWHEAFLVGSCYLALSVLAIQAHQK
jgi:hypothetical protein